MNKLYKNNDGFEAEEIVKKTLWRYGYSVKHLRGASFDLLVNNNINVEVKSSKFYLLKNGGYEWRFTSPYLINP